jgi:hypothetical protein
LISSSVLSENDGANIIPEKNVSGKKCSLLKMYCNL